MIEESKQSNLEIQIIIITHRLLDSARSALKSHLVKGSNS